MGCLPFTLCTSVSLAGARESDATSALEEEEERDDNAGSMMKEGDATSLRKSAWNSLSEGLACS